MTIWPGLMFSLALNPRSYVIFTNLFSLFTQKQFRQDVSDWNEKNDKRRERYQAVTSLWYAPWAINPIKQTGESCGQKDAFEWIREIVEFVGHGVVVVVLLLGAVIVDGGVCFS